MVGASELILCDYKVNRIHFEINNSYKSKEEIIQINPKFTRGLTKLDANRFIIELGVIIDNTSNSLPFSCEIQLNGRFELIHWETDYNREFLLDNTSSILFPYLRNVLFTVTMNANVHPYTLPVMNITKLFH